jgi:hypothetical protein
MSIQRALKEVLKWSLGILSVPHVTTTKPLREGSQQLFAAGFLDTFFITCTVKDTRNIGIKRMLISNSYSLFFMQLATCGHLVDITCKAVSFNAHNVSNNVHREAKPKSLVYENNNNDPDSL